MSKEASGTRCSLSQPCSTNSAEPGCGSALSHLRGRQTLQVTDKCSWAPEDPPHCDSAGGGIGGGTGWCKVSQDLAQRMSCHGDELPPWAQAGSHPAKMLAGINPGRGPD